MGTRRSTAGLAWQQVSIHNGGGPIHPPGKMKNDDGNRI
jgi:hypothetical protein